jgi:hypothetical protein
MPALKPTLIGFQRAGDVVPVAEGDGLPIETSTIDTLLIGEAFASSTARDLLGSTDPESPTLTQTAPYKRLILYLFVTSAATITITLRGRATDASGVPLSTGWLTLYSSGNISAGANSWHRIVMQASDNAPLGADQYRIEITSSTSQSILFNLKGER